MKRTRFTYKQFNDRLYKAVTEFSSIQDMVTYIKTTEVNKEVFRPRMNSKNGLASTRQKQNHDEWAGTDTFDEALNLLNHGWTEKAKELEDKLSRKLNKEASQVVRQKSVYDIVGGNCSVPRYLQGVPNSMIRQVRTPVKQKVMTVNYNISFNCDVTAEEITNNAVECLAYVKQLEDAGTRVALNVVWITKDFNDLTLVYSVPVKKTSERFSLAKVAFCLCNPSMLRRIMFSCLERDPDATTGFIWGYGRSLRGSEAEKALPDTKFYN